MMQPPPRQLADRVTLAASLLALAAMAMLGSRVGAAPVSKATPLPAPVMSAGNAVAPARLEAHVRFLADDALEGRGTGTRGYDKAAQYVAEQMQGLGLTPGGRGGYLQPVPLLRADLQPAACSFELRRDGQSIKLEVGRDVLLSPDFLRTKWTTETGLVFVGYGVSAPELGYDDFAGLDVRGKVLVAFRGAPPRFPNNERAYYSNSIVKDQLAAAHGAIGVLQIQKPADEARAPWERNMRQNKLPGFRWTDAGGAPSNVQATLELAGSLSRMAEEKVFEGAPKSYVQVAADAESSLVQSFALPWSLKAVRVTQHQRTSSPNVVGVLRGSDPRLRNEAVVISAHLDHLGISEPVNGDSVNNGAYDNASGTAMMLECARAFAALKVRPKRSLIFLSVTGEEKGLQGSDYFAQHDAPESLDVVGDMNLDMVLLLRPLTKSVAIGAEHSSWGPVMERAAALAGIELVPDPIPAEVVFVRSDQFSFIKQGIPSVFPVSANDGTSDGLSEVAHWRTDHYHSPNDDLSQPFDWASGARFTSMAFWATWLVADTPQAPKWNPGDFFGNRFGPRP
ncbi:MAG: M28 family metallopeptidase [Candidatus Eisenbacteria bacterium]